MQQHADQRITSIALLSCPTQHSPLAVHHGALLVLLLVPFSLIGRRTSKSSGVPRATPITVPSFRVTTQFPIRTIRTITPSHQCSWTTRVRRLNPWSPPHWDTHHPSALFVRTRISSFPFPFPFHRRPWAGPKPNTREPKPVSGCVCTVRVLYEVRVSGGQGTPPRFIIQTTTVSYRIHLFARYS